MTYVRTRITTLTLWVITKRRREVRRTMWGLVRISDIMKGGNDLSIVYTNTKLPKRGKLTREGTCLDWNRRTGLVTD